MKNFKTNGMNLDELFAEWELFLEEAAEAEAYEVIDWDGVIFE